MAADFVQVLFKPKQPKTRAANVGQKGQSLKIILLCFYQFSGQWRSCGYLCPVFPR
jgi:hypothetical protein